MPELVVDLLEPVEVDLQDRDPTAGTRAPCSTRSCELVGERPAVRQSGQRVVARLVPFEFPEPGVVDDDGALQRELLEQLPVVLRATPAARRCRRTGRGRATPSLDSSGMVAIDRSPRTSATPPGRTAPGRDVSRMRSAPGCRPAAARRHTGDPSPERRRAARAARASRVGSAPKVAISLIRPFSSTR